MSSVCCHIYDDDLLIGGRSRPGDLCRLCLEPKPPSYAQVWARVHPMEMIDYVQEVNALGLAVQAVVSIEGSWSLGVLSGPAPGGSS